MKVKKNQNYSSRRSRVFREAQSAERNDASHRRNTSYGNECFTLEWILRMELFKMKEIKTVPAQSANFQPTALFQHLMLSSNPFGIPTRSVLFQPMAHFQHLMLSSNPFGIPTILAEGSLPVRHVLWRAPFHPALLAKVRGSLPIPSGFRFTPKGVK